MHIAHFIRIISFFYIQRQDYCLDLPFELMHKRKDQKPVLYQFYFIDRLE